MSKLDALKAKNMRKYGELVEARLREEQQKFQSVCQHLCRRIDLDPLVLHRSTEYYSRNRQADYMLALSSTIEANKLEFRDKNYPLLTKEDTLKYSKILALQNAKERLLIEQRSGSFDRSAVEKMMVLSRNKTNDELKLHKGIEEDQLTASYKHHNLSGSAEEKEMLADVKAQIS